VEFSKHHHQYTEFARVHYKEKVRRSVRRNRAMLGICLKKPYSFKTRIKMKNPQGFLMERKSVRQVHGAGVTELNANFNQPSWIRKLNMRRCVKLSEFIKQAE